MTDIIGAKRGGVKRKRNFLDDEAFSDVIIKFGDKQVFAHKVMLASGSVWFERALSGNFSEANKKVIELHDDVSSDAVMFMLEFLYGKTYKIWESKRIRKSRPPESDYPRSLPDHLEVLILGDKYDIDSLKTAAADYVEDYIEVEMCSGPLSDHVIAAIQQLVGPQDAQLAYQSLVEIVEKAIIDHAAMLLNDNAFRELLAKGLMLREDLAIDYLNEINNTYDK